MSEEVMIPDEIGNAFAEADSKSTGGANKLPATDAKYLLRLAKVVMTQSTHPNTAGDWLLIFDFEIVESNNPEVLVDSVRSWTCNITRTNSGVKYGLKDAKGCMATFLGLEAGSPEANDLGNDVLKAFLAGKVNGELAYCVTSPKVAKNGNDWTKHNFSPVGVEA